MYGPQLAEVRAQWAGANVRRAVPPGFLFGVLYSSCTEGGRDTTTDTEANRPLVLCDMLVARSGGSVVILKLTTYVAMPQNMPFRYIKGRVTTTTFP